ncbi:MAG TPA: alpha-L-arabinofuranosidase, partial [Parafilimonas sp.]
ATITVTVDASTILTKISPCLLGNNANPYMTQMVTEPALLTHITNLHPKIIRFPGGNLSSVYFWNAAPGNPPADAPSKLLDADGNEIDPGYWYGKNTDSWTISLDNYYNMLQQTNNEGIITVNYAYARYSTAANPVAAAAHLAADWIRYDNGRTKYWEIGNESNGTWQAGYRIDVSQNKDGQTEIITGDLYGRHFKIFADSMRAAATEIGKTIYIGAQLLDAAPQSWQDATDQTWNSGVLSEAGSNADYFIVHDYFTPYQQNSSAADILATAPAVTKSIMDYLNQTTTSAGVSLKPVALTEWNIFAEGSMQMVSNVAGMHAVMVLGELMKNKFGEASRWDLANGWDNGNDQGLFSNGDEPNVARWTPRPAFYYMYFFKQMLGDRFINSAVSGSNSIVTYASTYSSGEINVTLVNTSSSAQIVKLAFKNFNVGNRFYWYTLVGGTDNNGFSRKVFVNGQGPSSVAGGPDNYTTLKAYSSIAQSGIQITLPPMSVVCTAVDKK